jgi:alpha-ketoglutarate-dependent taurine dioxygenase
MSVTFEPIKPDVGDYAHVDRDHFLDEDVIAQVRTRLEQRGVLVFPGIAVSDEQQLAFTDAIGGRADFGEKKSKVPGSDATAQDVYKITLDRKINTEPDYVLGTFFWHIDGLLVDIPLPKATVLSARQLSDSGGSTEFANLYAAYEGLPEDEKRDIADLRVIHTIEAAVRPVFGTPPAERLERYRTMAPPMEQPLVWTHADGRKSLLLGTHADGIVGWPGPHGRSLLTRLQQWAAQPAYTYRHDWQVGDLVVWDNEGMMHRVVPYTDEGRVMHRTSIAGTHRPGRPADTADVAKVMEAVL